MYNNLCGLIFFYYIVTEEVGMASYNVNNRNKKEKEEKKFSFFLILPVIAVLAIIPLITFYYKYDTKLDQFEWYSGRVEQTDFFLHYKSVALILVSIYMVFAVIYMVFGEERKFAWDKKLIPLLVYAIISFISAIASKYSYFSFNGIYEQFEPVWVLIGYFIIVYYCFFVFQEETVLRRTMRWFIAGISIMAALGLSQAFKHDFLRTEMGQKLISPETGLEFKFELGRAYLTVYNPNYVGFYATLVVPVLVALIFTTKKLWCRIGYAFLAVSLVIILFASQSRAGVITIIVSLVIMLLCMRKVFLKNWKITVIAIAVFAVAFIGINVMNQNILIDRMKSMFSTTPETHPLESIVTNDDNVTIKYNGNSLVFKVEQDEANNDIFNLEDGSGSPVSYSATEDNSAYKIDDTRFPFTFSSVRVPKSFYGFLVTIDGQPWYFSNLMKPNNKTYYALGGNMSLMKLTEHEKSLDFLENHYHFANGRGYIWARTLPLLKKYFLLGSGPETFVIAFPNNDLVGLYNSWHQNEIVTKPHCLYLQTAVQTGVPSLIALLLFFIFYIVSSFTIYWKHSYEGYLPKIGVAILASSIGYMILALTNDSCVATSPIFFALIGIGLGINYRLKKDIKNNKLQADVQNNA